MTGINPPAIPAATQPLNLIASRMSPLKRELLAAVANGAVRWHRPAGNSVSRTSWIRVGERQPKVITGETNWLRSHGLAALGTPTITKAGISRPIILTARGVELLEMLTRS